MLYLSSRILSNVAPIVNPYKHIISTSYIGLMYLRLLFSDLYLNLCG